MGKYGTRQAPPPERPWQIHPVWRGIGCLMLLIFPPVAFAAGHLLVEANLENAWYPIPREFMGSFTIPTTSITFPHFYSTMMVATILLLLGFGVVMVIYAAMYSAVGPSRYGPLDSPPVRSGASARKRK